VFRNTQRLSRELAAAIAVVALAAPATSAAYQDLRNPDTRDAAAASQEAAIGAQREKPGYQDLRNPDTRHPAIESQRGGVTETPQSPGFDWGDAGIGAGAVLGVVLILLSVMFAVVHRRNRRAEAPGGSAVTS
jgi:hypothetical protein